MSIVDTKALDTVKAPIEQARGLPNAFYTDEDVFEAEKRVVFAQGWAAVGFGKDVPGAGDVKPVEFLGQPLLLVRGKDMQLKVFQNVCRRFCSARSFISAIKDASIPPNFARHL